MLGATRGVGRPSITRLLGENMPLAGQGLLSGMIAERTKDGIAAARMRSKRSGRQPLDVDKIAAALKLVQAGLSPTAAAKQLGLGRSTVYREVARANIEPSHSGVAHRTHAGFASGGYGA
jgi:Homeodomain-like domain